MTEEEVRELRYLVHWYRRMQRWAEESWRQKSQCEGKHGFETHNQASRSISPRLKRYTHAYRCPHCSLWHIGSRATGHEHRLLYEERKSK
jgi:hypothetical protein